MRLGIFGEKVVDFGDFGVVFYVFFVENCLILLIFGGNFEFLRGLHHVGLF